MSDNSFEEEFKKNEDNSLINAINDISCSTNINTTNQIPTNQNSTVNNLNKEIKYNKIPYLNKDKIPEIKIKDENYLYFGQKIEDYIKSLTNFDDNIYNICNKCKINVNKYFCEKCLNNFCDICYLECKNKEHKLIDLEIKQKEIDNYVKRIKKIIADYFKLFKTNNFDKKMSESIDEDINMVDDNIIENQNIYTYDIFLTEIILEKNYTNYFHYKNIEECFKYIEKKYDLNNQILIEYLINNNEKEIKIFGYEFVKNNKDKCIIIYQNNEYDLNEFFDLNNHINNNSILQIKLIGINNITNMSYLFHKCSSLISLPDMSKWNTVNITNMGWLFYECTLLKTLSDISNWNTISVNNMSFMFSKCSSLNSLPDISKWDLSNVNNIIDIFNGCSSLLSLPDISKWNTDNINYMSGLFYKCSSLISLPDISKWNTKNVVSMSWMFYECLSLDSFPDILKWNTNKVTDKNWMFHKCKAFESFPQIIKNKYKKKFGLI